jgi:hypothetical protein
LLKTQQAGKGLADAVVICKVWILAIALYLLVVTSGVYKLSINLFINPYHVYSHTPSNTRDIRKVKIQVQ